MLPNTVIASEINPLCGATPDNMPASPSIALKQQMALWYRTSLGGDTLADVVKDLLCQCERRGLQLIIRDWTHHDFRKSTLNHGRPSYQFKIIRELEEVAELTVFAFVRDAIDVYLSSKPDLNDFAKDYFAYVREILKNNIPIVKYEDIVSSPDHTVRAICDMTGLTYSDSYRLFTENTRCTGDIQLGRVSRGIRQKSVAALPRKRMARKVRSQIDNCDTILQANRLLGYPALYNNGRVETSCQMLARRVCNCIGKLCPRGS